MEVMMPEGEVAFPLRGETGPPVRGVHGDVRANTPKTAGCCLPDGQGRALRTMTGTPLDGDAPDGSMRHGTLRRRRNRLRGSAGFARVTNTASPVTGGRRRGRSELSGAGRSWADHPFVVLLSVVAAAIGVIVGIKELAASSEDPPSASAPVS